MKIKAISITIPEPCTQNWDLMEERNGHKFCSSCQKTVTDFTGYSNAEIIKVLSASNSGICGRVTSVQLTQLDYYLIPIPQHSSWMKYLGVLAIGTVLFMESCSKNNVPKKPEIVNKIYGYVIGADHKPIIDYNVKILNTNLYAKTDQNGRYEMLIDKKLDTTNNRLSTGGFDFEGSVTINYLKEKQDTLKLQEKEFTVMGLMLPPPIETKRK